LGLDLIQYLSAVASDNATEGDGISYDDFINGIFSLGRHSTRKDTLEILSVV
jgi:hypothetical protein